MQCTVAGCIPCHDVSMVSTTFVDVLLVCSIACILFMFILVLLKFSQVATVVRIHGKWIADQAIYSVLGEKHQYGATDGAFSSKQSCSSGRSNGPGESLPLYILPRKNPEDKQV